eukprot:GSMAST32.ASY1.ANO1.1500.1 assembled CDS
MFDGEEGLDQGGVTKDWIELMAHELFRPDYGLFVHSEVDDASYRLSSHSGEVQPAHLEFFRFFGAVLARVRPLYKHLLALPLSLSDVEFCDKDMYRSLCEIRDMDPEDVEDLMLDFSITSKDAFGSVKCIPLKRNGFEEEVTADNRDEFITLNGFYSVLPLHIVSVFDYQELELIISGIPEIDVRDWKSNTVYCSIYNPNHQVIRWFWECVEEFSHEQRARLLQFVTGTARVPIQGFQFLQSDGGIIKPFKIMPVRREMCMYPRAHTCFNSVELPLYTEREELKYCLEMVICMQATDKLGFADK